jgi:hypothetical protein
MTAAAESRTATAEAKKKKDGILHAAATFRKCGQRLRIRKSKAVRKMVLRGKQL